MRNEPVTDMLSVFAFETGRPLAERICERLGIKLGALEERSFEDGEHKVRPLENVRGRDVYIVQSLYGDALSSVNDKLVRTLFLIATLKDAGADRVTCVAPYLCYARKDRRTKPRDPVTNRYVAALFEAVGTARVVTLEVHNPAAYENAFRIPAEHLTASPLWVQGLLPAVRECEVVVVSPDAGGAKRAEAFKQALERKLNANVGFAFVEKFRSEGVLRGGSVVGDVKGRVAVLVDDLISSGQTLARAAAACRALGATSVHAMACHGVFSAHASRILREAELERVTVLNTISPLRLDPDLLRQRVQVLDCAPLLASAIRRLHTHGSLVALEHSEDLTSEL